MWNLREERTVGADLINGVLELLITSAAIIERQRQRVMGETRETARQASSVCTSLCRRRSHCGRDLVLCVVPAVVLHKHLSAGGNAEIVRNLRIVSKSDGAVWTVWRQ